MSHTACLTRHILCLLSIFSVASAFTSSHDASQLYKPSSSCSGLLSMSLFDFGGGSKSKPKVPDSPSERNNQAISAIKAAIASPKTPSFPLIECEFPALQALNKLGDGSFRSANQAEEANLSFAAELVKSITPVPFLGPKTWLMTSTAASNTFFSKAKSKVKGGSTSIHSLKDGLPNLSKGDICVLVTPSSRGDYEIAQRIAAAGDVGAVVIINGFAKDAKSVPAGTTMAYFLKPLTYNSQVAGYLTRVYPGKWTTIDVLTKEVLGSVDDSDILVPDTNTPDLRQPGRLVQKSVDERAIRLRKNK